MNRDTNEHTEHRVVDNPEVLHEMTDAAAKPIAYFLAGLALLIAFTFVAVWLMFNFFESGAEKTDKQVVSPLADPNEKPPGPLLQTTPGRDMQLMLEQEKKLADSYGWVNKASGIVRIPVKRAMDLVAQKGLPNLQPIGVYEPAAGQGSGQPKR